MHIKIQVEEFRNALNKILSVVDKKNLRPILTYTLIKTGNNQIHLSATDGEVSAKVYLQALCSEEKLFCINAKNIFEILREFPNDLINIEIDENENNLKIYYQDIHFSLLIYPSNDFPSLVFSNERKSFSVKSRDIIDFIDKTSHAISSDETRPYLNGIFLQEVNSHFRTVATDGHRLSLFEMDLNEKNIDTLLNGIIVPRKGVIELKKVAESYPDAEIKINVDDSFMYINAQDEYFLSIRLIAREYPKYQAVIPSKVTYLMKTDKNNFLNAVRRIKIMANEKTNGVRVFLKEKEMTITANHPSLGKASEKIAIDYQGKEMEIGFNAKYLIDTLSSFNDGPVSLELNNELSPVLIKSETAPQLLNIIMPLKL